MLSLLVISLVAAMAPAAAEQEFIYPEVFNDTERDAFHYGVFPDDFRWSTATSAYQIEGAWNIADKGASIWDTFTHEGGNIANDDTGDVACDSYNKYREDVQMIKAMGLSYYRFSLSWPRLLPDGTPDSASADGLRYYNDLINELLANGINPQVTLYHWDLPQALEDMNGFLNDSFSQWFEDYADYCFEKFGERVKFWITFNDPGSVAVVGYSQGSYAPRSRGYDGLGNDTYTAAHNLLLGHGRPYRKYDGEYRTTQDGQIGVTLGYDFVEPSNRSVPSDIEAADRALRFTLGWFANPIFNNGDYPDVMKEKIAFKSTAQGLGASRLPEFTEEEKAMLLGSSDFFGLSHYSSVYAADTDEVDVSNPPSYYKDWDVHIWADESWPKTGSYWMQVVPWGMRRIVNWVSNEYGQNFPIYVTENGVCTADIDDLSDDIRIKYYTSYINELLKAVDIDGVNVKGYTAWSLMDSFEWYAGYTERFGLYYVDFSDDDRPRTAKESVKVYTDIVSDNGFPSGFTAIAASCSLVVGVILLSVINLFNF